MEPPQREIEPGAAVEASDGRLGTVDEVVVRPETGELAYLVIRRGWSGEQIVVPAALIAAVPSQREVQLRVTREEARQHTSDIPQEALAHAEGSEIRIPIIEERLVPGKRVVDLGELRIHKRVEQAEEVVRQPITRDDVEIVRRPIREFIDEPALTREEDDWLVIPIMEEVLVVQKRLMLTEEIRVRRRQVVEEQEVRDTVRRERVEVEDATVYGVHGSDPSLTLPRPVIAPESEVTRPIPTYQPEEVPPEEEF